MKARIVTGRLLRYCLNVVRWYCVIHPFIAALNRHYQIYPVGALTNSQIRELLAELDQILREKITTIEGEDDEQAT